MYLHWGAVSYSSSKTSRRYCPATEPVRSTDLVGCTVPIIQYIVRPPTRRLPRCGTSRRRCFPRITYTHWLAIARPLPLAFSLNARRSQSCRDRWSPATDRYAIELHNTLCSELQNCWSAESLLAVVVETAQSSPERTTRSFVPTPAYLLASHKVGL